MQVEARLLTFVLFALITSMLNIARVVVYGNVPVTYLETTVESMQARVTSVDV